MTVDDYISMVFNAAPSIHLSTRLLLLRLLCFDPGEDLTLNVTPVLPSLILLQSRHPHQHVSGAVRVSIMSAPRLTEAPEPNALRLHH